MRYQTTFEKDEIEHSTVLSANSDEQAEKFTKLFFPGSKNIKTEKI